MSTNLNLGRKNKATATVLLKRNVFLNGKLVLGFLPLWGVICVVLVTYFISSYPDAPSIEI